MERLQAWLSHLPFHRQDSAAATSAGWIWTPAASPKKSHLGRYPDFIGAETVKGHMDLSRRHAFSLRLPVLSAGVIARSESADKALGDASAETHPVWLRQIAEIAVA